MTPNHPIQPLSKDDKGVLRFKKNEIVDALLRHAQKHGMDLNSIACMGFSNSDHQQFAQLIGYSLSGYSELSYVDDDAYAAAEEMATNKKLHAGEAREKVLENKLRTLRLALRKPMAELFGCHPDDLKVP